MADAKTITTSNGTVVKIKDQDMRNMTGDAFSVSSTYAVGDYCIYNNKLYRCTTAISTAGAWDSSKWAETQIGDEFSSLNSNLIGKFDAANRVETTDGNFAGLVKANQSWLIAVQYKGSNNGFVLVAHNYNSYVYTTIIKMDTGFTYVTNSAGTVNIKYNNTNADVWGAAYRLR